MDQAREQLDHAKEAEQRAERRAEQLAGELGGYRRMLTESAESLTEQRAMAMTAEAQRLATEQQLAALANTATILDHQAEPKINTARPTARGWGSRMRALLFRKIG